MEHINPQSQQNVSAFDILDLRDIPALLRKHIVKIAPPQALRELILNLTVNAA